MDHLLQMLMFTAITTAAVGALWFFAKPEAVFVVRIRAGNAEVTHGKVTAAFLAKVAEVCAEFKIQNAELRGVAHGQRISLRFTTNFPPVACQRLRNWWVESGWPPPHRQSSPGPRR